MPSRDEQTSLLGDGEQQRARTVSYSNDDPPVLDELDPAAIKRIVRKIDRRILPILFFTFVLNFTDKIILSSASVYGLTEDIVSTRNPRCYIPADAFDVRRTSEETDTHG